MSTAMYSSPVTLSCSVDHFMIPVPIPLPLQLARRPRRPPTISVDPFNWQRRMPTNRHHDAGGDVCGSRAAARLGEQLAPGRHVRGACARCRGCRPSTMCTTLGGKDAVVTFARAGLRSARRFLQRLRDRPRRRGLVRRGCRSAKYRRVVTEIDCQGCRLWEPADHPSARDDCESSADGSCSRVQVG